MEDVRKISGTCLATLATYKLSGLVAFVGAILVMSIAMASLQPVSGLHLPQKFFVYRAEYSRSEKPTSPANRRQDDDRDSTDEDLDHNASAPTSQEDDRNNDNNSDGYTDGEQDSTPSSDETPHDRQNQEDVERFFDDHLGASDQGGMDKENLPSTIKQTVSPDHSDNRMYQGSPQVIRGFYAPTIQFGANSPQVTTTMLSVLPVVQRGGTPILNYLDSQPTVATTISRVPRENKVVITRQIIHNPNYKNGLDLSYVASIPIRNWLIAGKPKNGGDKQSKTASSNEDGIYVAEGDDMEKIYVTRDTRRPFRIKTLGDFDPEEDFENAARDMDDRVDKDPGESSRHDRGKRETRSNLLSSKFPGLDTLHSQASESDEVTFSPGDDPYSSNIEAEVRDSPDVDADKFDQSDDQADGLSSEPSDENASSEKSETKKGRDADDDASWANDGVDDIDPPPQSDGLDKVIPVNSDNKARTDDPQESQNNSSTGKGPSSDYEDNQRMPNADYLKNYGVPDDAY